MSDKYICGSKTYTVKNAAGLSGVLIKSFDGKYYFRFYYDNDNFTDYLIQHDDLKVTIDSEELSALYTNKDNCILDHNPQVFGLKKVDSIT